MGCNFILDNGERCKKKTKSSTCHLHSGAWRFPKPDTCPVCFCSIHQTRRPLQCGHWIHRTCVIKSGKAECPICRHELTDLSIKQHNVDIDDILDDIYQDSDFEEIDVPQEVVVFAVVAHQIYRSLLEPDQPALEQLHFISAILNDILPISHPSHPDIARMLEQEAVNILNSI